MLKRKAKGVISLYQKLVLNKGGSFGGGKKGGFSFFGSRKKSEGSIFGTRSVDRPVKQTQSVAKTSPVVEAEQQQAVTKTIYANPTQITTEHAPFSPLLSEVSPVIIPENPQDEQKSKLSTSGIIGVGLALAAGLL